MYLKKLILPAIILLTLNLSAQNVPSYLPTNGLVGWWPFSGNAIDSSANGNNGVVYNSALTTDRFGKVNAAYAFNGVDSRIEVPDAASLRCQKITVSVWILNNSIGTPGQIIYKGSLNATGEAYSINCNLNSVFADIKIGSNCTSGIGWQNLRSKQKAVQGSWEHIVATYDGQTYKMYKNGTLDTSKLIAGLIDNCIGGELRFGFNHVANLNNGNSFNGVIDDIAIWNRALAVNEINQMYASDTTQCGIGNTGVNICNPQRSLHVKDVLRLEPRSFSPPNPSKGDMYFDGTINKLRVYDGTIWRDCW
ncbi:MAG: LamG domain-containing protein [Ferruginibacter sp.]